MSRDIVFINSLFPCLSETFVYDQFVALRKEGMSFHIVSNNRPTEEQIHPRMRGMQKEVTYLCDEPLSAVVKAHARALLRNPWRYLFALMRVPFSQENLRTSLAQLSGAAMILSRFSGHKKLHLHAHFTYGAAAVALWAKRLAGVTYSLTVHGSDLIFDNPHDLSERLENAEGIISISQFNVDFLRQHFPKVEQERVRVIHMGVPPLTEVLARPVPLAYLRILNVGRLSIHKAQHDLISACAILRDQGVLFQCTIVGEGEKRAELEGLIDKLALGKFVELAGACFHDEVLALYAQYDLFVLCSITEGQPIVIMEAMRAGIPVIASNISAIPELIQDAGTLVPPSSPAALAEAILAFLADNKGWQWAAANARGIISNMFNLEKNNRVFKKYLDDLV